jgi:hypothetical protein
MRALKLLCLAAVSIVGLRYGQLYYNTYQFNEFVQQALQKTRSAPLLKQVILRDADSHQLPIGDRDITVMTSNSMLRVSIEYQVPVDFYVFQHVLNFRSVASDFSR